MKSVVALTLAAAAGVSAVNVVDPNNLPHKSMPGQVGYNDCGTTASKTSKCQTSWIEDIQDWCIFAPMKKAHVANVEEKTVTYCTKARHGARLIPKGALKGVQFLETDYFRQITGLWDPTGMGVIKGDSGGELDPHGASNVGNPIGGLYLGHINGELKQFVEWDSFVGDGEFSIRACKTTHSAADQKKYCAHIYDEMGARWNSPGKYKKGVFEQCDAGPGLPPGIYGTSTFTQGAKKTPAAHPAPKSSNCVEHKTISVASYPSKKRQEHVGHAPHGHFDDI